MRPLPRVVVVALAISSWMTAPAKADDLVNPGFESPPPATNLGEVIGWTGAGPSGSVSSAFAHEGIYALQISGTGGIVKQSISATGHWKYVASVRALRPSTDTSGAFVASGWLRLSFLDATGGTVLAMTDALPTNAARDTWHELRVATPAPFASTQVRIELGWTWNPYFWSNSASVYFDSASLAGTAPTNSDCGILHNPGFDDGPPGNASSMSWLAPEDILPWEPLSGTNNVFVTPETSHDGDQCVAITFIENYVAQSFVTYTGMSYAFTAWAMTPTGDPMSGARDPRFIVVLDFFDGTNHVSAISGKALTTNDPPGTWIPLGVTGRAPHRVITGNLTGRVLVGVNGWYSNYTGTVFADSMCLTPFSDPLTNTQSGALWNPGFEYSAPGTKFEHIDDWTGFGNAGVIDGTRARSGNNSLMIYWTETLVGQIWAATGNQKYATSAYLMSPSNEPFRTSGDAKGLVILQYLNATGGVIASYASADFTPTSPTNTWIYHEARGVAPLGTTHGRTLLGIVAGPGSNYGGAILFDDASQWNIPIPTTNGLLVNGSFDDGPAGNVFDLSPYGHTFGWNALAGNSIYVTPSRAFDGEQSLAVNYTESLAEQLFQAVTGATYRVDGYMFVPTPPEGLSGGIVLLEFFEGTNQYTFASPRFSADPRTGVWKRVSVMGTAPSSGSITGRVLVGIIGADNFGGTVWFDALSLSNVPPLEPYDLWKFNSFGDTNIANGGPADDYDGDRVDNESERVAGTIPTDSNSQFIAKPTAISSNGGCIITWPSVRGRIYRLEQLSDLLTGEVTGVATGLAATPPTNTYEDAPGPLPAYYRIGVELP